MKIVTYATHEQGKFKELINNKYNIKIDVVGWGVKWNGFRDKYIGILDYLHTVDDDEIVIFLDGFDTIIERNPLDVERTFKKLKCNILVSKDPNLYGEAVSKYIFGTCKDDQTANSGMYMGYAKYLKEFLKKALTYKCKDDQKTMNTSCSLIKNIKVDKDEIIFQNVPPSFKSYDNNKTPYFKSFPGSLNFKRIYRGILFEYPQFFIRTIALTCLLLMYLYPKKSPYILLIFIIYYLIMDHSCES